MPRDADETESPSWRFLKSSLCPFGCTQELSTWVSFYISMPVSLKENFSLGLAPFLDLSIQIIQLKSKFFSLYLTFLASHPYHQHLILLQGPLSFHCQCFHACVSHFKFYPVITNTDGLATGHAHEGFI